MTNNKRYPDVTTTGTTTSAYVAALTIYEGAGAVFVLKDKDASNNMYYKIDAYLTEDSAAIAYPVKAETSLTANTAVMITDLNFPFYKAIFYVEWNTAAAAYQLDCIKYL